MQSTDTSLFVQDTPSEATSLYAKSIPLDYCTPLREVEVRLAGEVVDMGLLDDGSEIVVIRKDLWEKVGHGANAEKKMLMQAANGSTQMMDGCAEFLELEIGGMKTWAHAYVVPFAPFKLLLGRPWQRSVLLQKSEYDDGRVTITIHNPKDRREARVVETT